MRLGFLYHIPTGVYSCIYIHWYATIENGFQRCMISLMMPAIDE
ncbi:MAG TPA: hypothetical protein VGQ04_19185 [Chitinophagaceae bacterium]|nr:hypothetical protein [Chitinophagaceae bacterium]